MTTLSTTPRTVILTAVDNTLASQDALRTSAFLGATLAGAEIHLLHVVAPPVVTGGPDSLGAAAAVMGPTLNGAIEAGRAALVELAKQVEAMFKGRIVTHLAVGSPQREILQMAANLEADVVVVGSHNRGTVQRWLLGSVSEQVVRKARCAVIVARPKDYGTNAPEIEPPCPDCVKTQQATAGEKLWCERHSQHHVHGHLHYSVPPSFGVGSSLLRPGE